MLCKQKCKQSNKLHKVHVLLHPVSSQLLTQLGPLHLRKLDKKPVFSDNLSNNIVLYGENESKAYRSQATKPLTAGNSSKKMSDYRRQVVLWVVYTTPKYSMLIVPFEKWTNQHRVLYIRSNNVGEGLLYVNH